MECKKKYSSGAEKRKKRKEVAEKIAKHRKMDAFFPSLNENENGKKLNSITHHHNDPLQNLNVTNCSVPIRDNDNSSMQSCSLDKGENVFTENNKSDSNTEEILESSDKNTPERDENSMIQTDMGYFCDKFITDEIKKIIISSEPNQPKGPFKKDFCQGNRHFSETYYYSSSKYGQIKRSWLCYSRILDAAYCQSCWLFSSEDKNPWRTGIRDWQGFSKKLKLHASSMKHIQACRIHDQWKKLQTIDRDSEEKIKENVSFWKKVLERLFQITLMLSKNSLAFRGHREQINDSYNGNFLSVVNLLAKYDDTLKQIIDKPKNSIKYLSPAIQNEIIECLGVNLKNLLLSEIQSAPFFSLIVDTTQDITKKDQISLIFRYILISRDEEGNPTKVEIKESFLGFYEAKERNAQGLTDEILGFLKNNNIDINKCRGQGYDGASVMRGPYNSVRKLINDIEPLALYVHCASHNLNLVINDAVSGCKDVSNFFTTLQQIYNFFGSSINRWDLLSNFSGESEITLKKLNPTRWSSRINSLKAVKYRLLDIIKALTEISLKSVKKEERNEASQILKKITKFEFVFITTILHDLLDVINYASKILQQKNIDLQEASNILKSAKSKLSEFRLKYEAFKFEASSICKKLNIPTDFASKRHKHVKRQFDEYLNDFKFENSEKLFKVNVFYCVVDIVNTQLDDRFGGMEKVSNLFYFLQPKYLLTLSVEELLTSAQNLQQHYCSDLGANFPMQLVNAVTFIKDSITEKSTVKELADLFLIKFSYLESDFSELITSILLLLTLPVTVATAERSFSKLKYIKSYCRNSMKQERLKYLSLLAIESEQAQTLNVEQAITNFAHKKSRRVDI